MTRKESNQICILDLARAYIFTTFNKRWSQIHHFIKVMCTYGIVINQIVKDQWKIFSQAIKQQIHR